MRMVPTAPGFLSLRTIPLIQGITTNPSLLRKAGIQNYEEFAREMMQRIRHKPISWEVCSDDFPGMIRQARIISSWGKNAFVKIPITTSDGTGTYAVIQELAAAGIPLNVTAILTADQVRRTAKVLNPDVPAVVSVFAGRIADAGQDPVPAMQYAKHLLRQLPKAELLWASVREVWNLFEADDAGCDIVTVPHEILHKALRTVGGDLAQISLDTVRMFARDIAMAGYSL
jgi:transaldolase